jgi:hypothetical protein
VWMLRNLGVDINVDTLNKSDAWGKINTRIPRNGIRIVTAKRLVREHDLPFDQIVKLTESAAEGLLRRILDRQEREVRGGTPDLLTLQLAVKYASIP